ncbi:MAG: Fe-S cluster assembly protein SufD [Rhizonema sp. PD38]|nr:Fe-S cluster assembly protein SufD [Rhizonema sp. PD38]
MSIQVSPSLGSDTLLDRDDYLTGLLKLIVETSHLASLQGIKDETSAWLQELSQSATLWVRQSTLPTTRDEEWRNTDLSSLRQVQFDNNVETRHSASLDITQLTLLEAVNSRLVFVNGVYAPDLSAVSGLPDGVIVSNLAGLPVEKRLGEYLAQAQGSTEVFTALNTSGMSDVAVVWVAKNVVVETPIHLLFISIGEAATVSLPRCLVVAETGSSVILVEEFLNRQDAKIAKEEVYFTNAVTEIWVEDNARVSHTRIELDGAEAFHIGKTAVNQARYSSYTCHAVTLGAKLSRHNLEVWQAGEQTETTLNGLTMIGGKQLADTHSAIALNFPHGTSRQLHKCIVGDRAHSVFNGKIFVPKPAQLTNAEQLNRNLLLSSKARVDTKPQLEITADNVKCAHGATVSQLEDDEIFYLRSRGIDDNAARHLLINAFAVEIINQIPISSLRERLTQFVSR